MTVESLQVAVAKAMAARWCSDAFVDDIKPEREGTLLSAALEPLAASGEALPVVDKDGKYAGLVTTSAMLSALSREPATKPDPDPMACADICAARLQGDRKKVDHARQH